MFEFTGLKFNIRGSISGGGVACVETVTGKFDTGTNGNL